MKPIFDELKKFAEDDIYPFCMPGHKKGLGIDFCGINPFSMDITEIEGLDNLHNPEGIIKKAQDLAAETFGADESFFLVNGSTSGLQGAILSCCNDGEKIIVARNCHRSVYSGIIFSRAVPIYIYPQYIEKYGFYGSMTVEEVENAIENNKDAKAIVITSPTYEGITSDIESISKIAHDNNMILIVDEAHGAHTKFNDFFPKTALECGADIVVQSLHKTLPAVTQTAILHIKGDFVNKKKLKNMLAMVQSSSPSYIFMGIIDLCREMIDKKGEAMFDKYAENIKKFREQMKCLKNIKLIDKFDLIKYNVYDIDLGKFVFSLKNCSITGVDLVKILRENFNLQLEMGDKTNAIAMTSVCDSEDGFLRLANAIIEIDKTLIEYEENQIQTYFNIMPKMAVTPGKAVFSKNSEQELDKSIGRISGDFVIPYPPGIPLIVPGEIITREIVTAMNDLKNSGIELLGADDSSFCTIRLLDNM